MRRPPVAIAAGPCEAGGGGAEEQWRHDLEPRRVKVIARLPGCRAPGGPSLFAQDPFTLAGR